MAVHKTGIDPLAYVAPTAKLGKAVYIAPFACVGDGAEIGDNTSLHPHATVQSHLYLLIVWIKNNVIVNNFFINKY